MIYLNGSLVNVSSPCQAILIPYQSNRLIGLVSLMYLQVDAKHAQLLSWIMDLANSNYN